MVTFPIATNGVYEIQETSNINSAQWTTVSPIEAREWSSILYYDQIYEPMRFYRIIPREPLATLTNMLSRAGDYRQGENGRTAALAAFEFTVLNNDYDIYIPKHAPLEVVFSEGASLVPRAPTVTPEFVNGDTAEYYFLPKGTSRSFILRYTWQNTSFARELHIFAPHVFFGIDPKRLRDWKLLTNGKLDLEDSF